MKSLLTILASLLIIAVTVSGCTNDGSSGSTADEHKSASNQDNDIVVISGGNNSVRIGGGDGDSVSVNGLTISYPKTFVRADLKIENNDVRIEFKSHQLEIVNGLLKFDGKAFGAVQKGDQIAVQDDGSIVVNSKTVTAQ